MRLTQLIEALNTHAIFEKNLMEKFSQQDVDKVSGSNGFWTHPASGKIYHSGEEHVNSALAPGNPIGLTADEFADIEPPINWAVYDEAFKKGWIRTHYIPNSGDNSLGNQIALQGPDEETVRLALKMFLEQGLPVDYVGMRGQFDGFKYDAPMNELTP